MADARSLLRQQRAARRIEHPHAAYSDAGKLLCTICHEHVKADSLWDAHVRGSAHRQRVQASKLNGNGNGTKKTTTTPSDEQLLAQALGQKRKHGEDEDGDEEMLDDDAAQEEAVRKKRSRQDIASTADADGDEDGDGTKGDGEADSGKSSAARPSSSKATPPGLSRRISGTPVHGVELQIPSRPATPNAAASGAATSATSTPKFTPVGRSPLIPQDQQNSSAPLPAADSAKPPAKSTPAAGADDDADWAAFESEVVNAAPTGTTTSFSADAVISAAPMTAEEIAARSQEEDRAKRRAAADIEIEDEKEEASRALETEFEEMEELEARVKRLKEKREALRSQGSAAPVASAAQAPAKPLEGKENGGAATAEDEDDDEDDEDEDDDDWNSFRFRG